MMMDELSKVTCVGSFQSICQSKHSNTSLAYNYLSKHDNNELMDRVTFAHVAQLIMLQTDVMKDGIPLQTSATMLQRYLPEVQEQNKSTTHSLFHSLSQQHTFSLPFSLPNSTHSISHSPTCIHTRSTMNMNMFEHISKIYDTKKPLFFPTNCFPPLCVCVLLL